MFDFSLCISAPSTISLLDAVLGLSAGQINNNRVEKKLSAPQRMEKDNVQTLYDELFASDDTGADSSIIYDPFEPLEDIQTSLVPKSMDEDDDDDDDDDDVKEVSKEQSEEAEGFSTSIDQLLASLSFYDDYDEIPYSVHAKPPPEDGFFPVIVNRQHRGQEEDVSTLKTARASYFKS